MNNKEHIEAKNLKSKAFKYDTWIIIINRLWNLRAFVESGWNQTDEATVCNLLHPVVHYTLMFL